MPWIDLAVAASLVTIAIVGIAYRGAAKIALIVSSATALGLLVAAFVLEGGRWQLIALAILALLVAALVAWSRRRRRSRLSRGVSTIGVVAGIAVVAVAAWALPPAFVPAPTGTFSVGVSSTLFTDATRNPRGQAADGSPRSLPVTIWYPSSAPETGGPLLADDAETTVAGLAHQFGLPDWTLRELVTARGHATPDAPAREGDFPVVLFSPGLASSRWLSASWATEVASHGVVVIALDHPYDSASVEIADGTVALSELVSTGDDETDNLNADAAAATRAADLSAVLDTALAERATVPALAGADVDRIVAAGHSLGGAAALSVARTDARVDGVVDIDGMPRSTVIGRSIPAVLLVAGDADPNPGYAHATDAFVADGAVRVTVDGVAHFGFTDASLVLAPVPTVVGVAASTGPGTAAAATLAVVDAVTRGVPITADAVAELGTVG